MAGDMALFCLMVVPTGSLYVDCATRGNRQGANPVRRGEGCRQEDRSLGSNSLEPGHDRLKLIRMRRTSSQGTDRTRIGLLLVSFGTGEGSPYPPTTDLNSGTVRDKKEI